jgi:hypothetical protein
MHDHASQPDSLAIDRLVDNELSPAERRQLLLALESHPGGWRQCALAFVEAQRWGAGMRRLVAESPAKGSAVPEASLAPNAVESHAGRRSSAWLGIAAGLLAAFGLGYQIGGPVGAPPAAQIAQNDGPQPAAPKPLPPVHNGDAVTLVVNDRQGRPQRVETSLVEASRLGAGFADAPQWSSPQLHQQLRQQGLGLEARRRYVPIYFEQPGGLVPMVVPVDDAKIVPVSPPVF